MDKISPLAKTTAGLLLAGGRSRRFGAEKAMAPFAGRPMMDSVLARFAPLAHCAVSARAGSKTAERAHDLNLPVLHDPANAPPGPLAGVAAGLAWLQNTSSLRVLATAPCDAPVLPLNLFSRLLDVLGNAPAAFAATKSGDHPLCAVWRVELSVPVTLALAASRHPPVRHLLCALGARSVFFEEDDAFANANTPETLSRLESAA